MQFIYGSLFGGEQDVFAFRFRCSKEVNAAIDAPDGRDAESEVRFFPGSIPEEGNDEVGGHAGEVSEQAEAWDEEVPYEAVVGAFVEGDDAQEATERVKNEGAEVGGECDGQNRTGQRRHLVVRHVSEAGEDAVWQSGDGCITGSAAIAEVERDANHTDDGRYDRQGPNGAARRQGSGMKQAEVLGRLIVFSHGISDAGARIHATEGGANERQEDGEGLSEHEPLAIAMAE